MDSSPSTGAVFFSQDSCLESVHYQCKHLAEIYLNLFPSFFEVLTHFLITSCFQPQFLFHGLFKHSSLNFKWFRLNLARMSWGSGMCNVRIPSTSHWLTVDLNFESQIPRGPISGTLLPHSYLFLCPHPPPSRLACLPWRYNSLHDFEPTSSVRGMTGELGEGE